jgi:hypothetical protein
LVSLKLPDTVLKARSNTAQRAVRSAPRTAVCTVLHHPCDEQNVRLSTEALAFTSFMQLSQFAAERPFDWPAVSWGSQAWCQRARSVPQWLPGCDALRIVLVPPPPPPRAGAMSFLLCGLTSCAEMAVCSAAQLCCCAMRAATGGRGGGGRISVKAAKAGYLTMTTISAIVALILYNRRAHTQAMGGGGGRGMGARRGASACV